MVQPHEVLHFYQDLVEVAALSWKQRARSRAAENYGRWLRQARHETERWRQSEILPAARHLLRWHAVHHSTIYLATSRL